MANLIYGRKKVWDEIFALKAAKGTKKAAIAFFGKGAMLQFRQGDLLIVDASTATIESGGTSPSRLLDFARNGVEVRHYAGLHAKVICFEPGTVVVGSMNASRSSQNGLFEAATVHYDKEAFKAATEMMEHLRAKSEKLSMRKLTSLLAVEKSVAVREYGEGGGDQKFARADGPVRGIEKGSKAIYASVTSSNSQSPLVALAGEAEKSVRVRAGKSRSYFFHPDAPAALKSLNVGDRVFLGERESRKDKTYDVYKDCRVRKIERPSRKAIIVVYEFDPNVMTLPFEKFKKLVGDEGLRPHSAGRVIAPERIDDILDGWLTA